jgi:hypothetical protein
MNLTNSHALVWTVPVTMKRGECLGIRFWNLLLKILWTASIVQVCLSSD